MPSRRAFLTLAVLVAAGVRCGVDSGRGLEIFFDIEGPLSDNMTVLKLTLYEDPPAGLCDEEAMLAPLAWTPTTVPAFEVIDMTYDGTVERDLNPGTWGFVFRGGNTSDFVVGTRDMARGCAVVELGSGINPPVTLQVYPIFYPGVCGDDNLDPEEMCDDGNSADGDGCSADCRSTPVKVVHAPETTSAGQYDPSIAGGAWGFVVAFTSDADMSEGSKYVRAQKLDANGDPSMMLVSTHIKFNAGSTNQSQEKPSVAAWGNNFSGTWLDFASTTSGPGDVRLRTIDSTNGSGAFETILNTETAGVQIEPVIAGNGVSTTLISAWTSSSSSPQDVMCRFIMGGVPQGSDTSCASNTTGDQNQPAAAMAPDGSHAVAWTGPDAAGTGVWVRFFTAEGIAVGTDVAVNTTTAGDQSHPAVAFDSTGRLLVVFRDVPSGLSPVIRGRLFDGPGTAAGNDFVISENAITSTGDAAEPAVAGDAGRGGTGVFIVVWYAPGAGVRGRLVSGQNAFAVNRLVGAPGDPFVDTGEFAVTPADYPESRDPQVAVSSPGKSLVIWVDSSAGPPAEEDVRGRIIPTS